MVAKSVLIKSKLNAIQFMSNTSMMMPVVFIPNFALELGANRSEIGIIGAAYGFSIFLSSFVFGRTSDIKGRKNFIILGLFLSTISFFMQIFANDAFSLAVIRALAGFSIGIFLAPLIAYTFESGFKLGAFSSYGSLGWAAGSILAGVIAQHGETLGSNPLLPYWEVFALSSLLFFCSLILSLTLPEVEVKRRVVPLFPMDLIKKNAKVYFPIFLRHLGAFSIWIIFPIFLAELGASKFWIGTIYFFNSGSQFLIMRYLDFKNDAALIKTGLFLSTIVFFSYTLTNNFYHVLPIQIMLALSYSSLYVGSLLFVLRKNEEKATSVGILNSFTSISVALGPIFGGMISQAFGFHEVMYFASSLSFVGLAIGLKLR